MRTGIEKFIENELKHCEEHDIEVIFEDSANLPITETIASQGWFDGSTIAVAKKRPLESWLSVFVHESCHKDQYLEKAECWDTSYRGADACDLLDKWLEKEIELPSYQLNKVIDIVKRVELDCEIRSVKKIVDNNLPINLDKYIKQANIYVLFYESMKSTRRWITDVCTDQPLLDAMPTYFLADYSRVSKFFKDRLSRLA